MPPVAAIVVDDEPLARQRIIDLLDRDPEVRLLAECADGHAAVDVILRQRPDLVFLDIQMPEIDGFRIIAEVTPEQMPTTIFVTAYDRYAIQAFDVQALDYLLKPYDDDRFMQALQRAKTAISYRQESRFHDRLMRLMQEKEGMASAPDAPRDRLPSDRLIVRDQGEALVVRTVDIDYVQGEGVYVRLHTRRQDYLVRERMAELERRLDPRVFCRIHRSTIVNLDRIQKLIPHFNGESLVVLHDGVRLKVSRSRRDHLQDRLGMTL